MSRWSSALKARLVTLDESADIFRRGERAGEAQLREGDISITVTDDGVLSDLLRFAFSSGW